MEIPNLNEPYEMSKNYATKQVRVEMDFDTNRWSSRMKNIVCKAIDTGVADCGHDTGYWIKNLLNHHGLGVQHIGTYWSNDLPVEMIKPDKVEEVISYLSALYRMNRSANNDSYSRQSYRFRYFMERLDESGWESIKEIPVPDFTKKDREVFIKKYLKPQEEQEALKRAELINLVRSGSLLSISYIINN